MAKRPFRRRPDLVKDAVIFGLAVLVLIGLLILFGNWPTTPPNYFPNIKNAL